jgi:hypothetical protein
VNVVPLRVCVESPFRGDVTRNVLYADACQLDCFSRNEAPFLGHLQYPRVLNDGDRVQRDLGIAAHLAWLRCCELLAVYIDLGITDGMKLAISLADDLGIVVSRRELGPRWLDRLQADGDDTPGFFLLRRN